MMVNVERYKYNPIIRPNREHPWEALAAFNGSVVRDNGKFHILYRAISYSRQHHGRDLNLSTIGYASGGDGVNFTDHYQFIKPEFYWEIFGCEDPRITKINGKYFIFYTAPSNYPPDASGIKIGLAITPDFHSIEFQRGYAVKKESVLLIFGQETIYRFAEALRQKHQSKASPLMRY